MKVCGHSRIAGQAGTLKDQVDEAYKKFEKSLADEKENPFVEVESFRMV